MNRALCLSPLRGGNQVHIEALIIAKLERGPEVEEASGKHKVHIPWRGGTTGRPVPFAGSC